MCPESKLQTKEKGFWWPSRNLKRKGDRQNHARRAGENNRFPSPKKGDRRTTDEKRIGQRAGGVCLGGEGGKSLILTGKWRGKKKTCEMKAQHGGRSIAKGVKLLARKEVTRNKEQMSTFFLKTGNKHDGNPWQTEVNNKGGYPKKEGGGK